MSLTPWQIFNRVPNAVKIAADLKDIPAHWSLTPLQEKSPRRKGWQSEDFIPHEKIADLILNGDETVSQKTGKTYRCYWSGFGLRLGEASGGLLAIDVDGVSAQPILEAICSGDIPPTVSWSSGKPGRYQLLFQIPERSRSKFQQFTRAVLTEWGELQTQRDIEGKPLELLEFRYNRCQSALPPSLHPSTGTYHWINSPVDTPVAIAPDWLCEILLQLAEGERQDEEAKLQAKRDREKAIEEAAERRKALGIVGSVDLIDCFAQSVARLSPQEIFNWSGHDFKRKGKEWFGCCPQHHSQSGESFTVRPDSLDWHCFGCDVGGGVGEYRHFVNGGKGTPKGKDFFEVTKELAAQAGIELPKQQPKEGFARGIKRQIERGVQNLVDKLAPKPEKNGFEESEPDPAEYAAYLQHEQQQLEAELAESRERQQQKKQDYPARAKAAWRKARRFTSDIQKATQWFEAELPPENSIFFGRAGLGRGKTTQLCKLVDQWKQQGKRFVLLGYRNTLLYQLCSDKKNEKREPKGLGFYHLLSDNAMLLRHHPGSGIALCVDSLWRLKPEDFDGKIIIIDELMSVIRHLLHSPTVKGRDNILELFHQALQRASQVVCLDGCMADWAVKYLHELAPDKKIIRLDNTYQGDKALINYLLGTVDIDEEVKKNDRSPWLHHLLNESQVPVICSDSQVFAESLDNLLSERGLKVLRIDSKTVPEEYIRECLKDCDAYIKQHQPDVIIYTPSAESGVDVSIKGYFTHHYGFFFGVLGVDAILQMLGRIRDSQCTKFVWVREWVAQSEQTHSRSPFTESVGKAVEKMLCQDITDTLTGIDKDEDIITKLWAIVQQSKNSHFQASNQIQAIANYEKGNLRECVLEALKASGYKVRCCTLNPEKATGETVKAATEATKRQNCHDIFTAEKIAVEFVEELAKKFDARWEDRVKLIQATYRSRLPGIDESSSWTEDFIYKIKYDNPDFLNQQEMFWLFSHPEVALRMNQERYHRLAQKEHTFIGNIRSRMAKIKALRDIGIEEFLDPEKTWMEDNPEVVALVNCCRDEKVAAALGKHPGQQTNIRFLGSLLKSLGLKHTGQKVKSDDGDYRVYRLDRDTITDVDRLNALKCLDTRWTSYLTQEVEILDWESVLNSQETTVTENYTCQQGGGYSQQAKPPQTQTEQAIDPVPRTPSEYIYINSPSWNQLESHGVSEDLGGAVDLVDPVGELVEVFEFCEQPRQFAAVIEGYSAEIVEKAIALADSQPRRQQLTAWHDQLAQQPFGSGGELAHEEEALAVRPLTQEWPELPTVGTILHWVGGGLEKLVLKAIDADGSCQVKSLLSGLFTNTRVEQLKAAPS